MSLELDKIYNEDCLEGLKELQDNSIDCCVTSPPYYALRDYGTGHWEGGDANCNHEEARIKTRFDYDISDKQKSSAGTDVTKYIKVCPKCGAIRVDEQIGLEETPEEYIRKLTEVFMEVHRVLKPTGTLWLNIGDSYNGYKGNANSEHNDSAFVGGHGGHTTMISGYGLEDKSLKPKDLIGIPWMLAFSLRNAGWYLRQDIIWHKPNPMPESVTDRCTKSHEYIFLMSKSQKYYYDNEAIQEKAIAQTQGKFLGTRGERGYSNASGNQRDCNGGFPMRTKNCQYDGQQPNTMHLRREQGLPDKEYFVRNKRDVWSVNVKPDSVAHFATYPEELIMPCVLAGCPSGGVVLDPFMGSGTTARVERKLNRHFVGFELNSDYCKIIEKKIQVSGDLFY